MAVIRLVTILRPSFMPNKDSPRRSKYPWTLRVIRRHERLSLAVLLQRLKYWVAVEEIKLNYHNGCIYIYIQ